MHCRAFGWGVSSDTLDLRVHLLLRYHLMLNNASNHSAFVDYLIGPHSRAYTHTDDPCTMVDSKSNTVSSSYTAATPSTRNYADTQWQLPTVLRCTV